VWIPNLRCLQNGIYAAIEAAYCVLEGRDHALNPRYRRPIVLDFLLLSHFGPCEMSCKPHATLDDSCVRYPSSRNNTGPPCVFRSGTFAKWISKSNQAIASSLPKAALSMHLTGKSLSRSRDGQIVLKIDRCLREPRVASGDLYRFPIARFSRNVI
jgi:hypothetical protein